MSKIIDKKNDISASYNIKPIKPISKDNEPNNENKTIAKILQQFNYRDINVDFTKHIEATRTITYFFELDEHHLNDIVRLDDNTTRRMLEIALKTSGISILAPVPGTSQIAVIVPKKTCEPVRLSNFVDEINKHKHKIPFVLGEDYLGNSQVIDLSKCHHQLIGGRTGSGKSNSLKAAITAIAMTCEIKDIRILLVDGKGIDLVVFNKLPHLLCPVITERTTAIKALRWLSEEMKRRMHLLHRRNIPDIWEYNKQFTQEAEEYNQQPNELMPAILLIIDEVQVLLNSKNEDAESLLRVITQQGRACGIIVVLSTQRPSVDIIQGSIKINLPGRIAFSLPSNIDSRVILDQTGAELLGDKGDLLAVEASFGKLMRFQAPLVTEKEIEEVCSSLKCQKKNVNNTDNDSIGYSFELNNSYLLGGNENIVKNRSISKNIEFSSQDAQVYKVPISKFAKVLIEYKDINELITKKYNDRTWHTELVYFPFLYGNVQKHSSLSKILYDLRTDRFIKKLMPLDTISINRNFEGFSGELQVFESLRDTATKITSTKDIPIVDSKSSDDREEHITSLIEKGFIGVTPKGYFIQRDFKNIPKLSGNLYLVDVPEALSKQISDLPCPVQGVVEQLRLQLWKIWEIALEKYAFIGLPMYRAVSTQADVLMFPACIPIWKLRLDNIFSRLENFNFINETDKDDRDRI